MIHSKGKSTAGREKAVPGRRRRAPIKGIVFAALIFLSAPLHAIPVGRLPLPFEISDMLAYRLYWIASICAGAAAVIYAVLKAAESKDKHAWFGAFFLITLFTLIFCEFLAAINTESFLYDDITRVGATMVACVIIAILPKLAGSRPDVRFPRTAALLFTISGSALFIHFLISAVVFFGFRYAEGAKYYDGHRVFPALVMSILLSIEILYFAMAIFIVGARNGWNRPGWRAMRRFAFVACAYVPAAVVIDYIRWLFPALWRIYPREDIFVLPLFAGFIFVDMIGYVRSYAAGMRRENGAYPGIPAEAGLTKRQCDVAVLLAQGCSYKEICSILSIKIGTIQTHVTLIYRKLGVSCKEDLMNLLNGRPTSTADHTRPRRLSLL